MAPRTNSMPGGNLHAVDKSALKPERPARVRIRVPVRTLAKRGVGPILYMSSACFRDPLGRRTWSDFNPAPAVMLVPRLASSLNPRCLDPWQEGDGNGVGGLDWEDSAGISAPLYDIVDVVFELGSRGFFRRQVLPWGCWC